MTWKELIHIMGNSYVDIFAYIGGCLLGVQMFPQIYKVFTSKSTNDISMPYLLLNLMGLAFMFAFGILTSQQSLYIPIALSLFNTCVIVVLKLTYDESDVIEQCVI